MAAVKNKKKVLRIKSPTRSVAMKPHFRKPKLIAKPNVTLEKLYNRIAASSWRESLSVQLVSVKETPVPKELIGYKGYKAATRTDENGNRHEMRIYYDTDRLGKKSKIIVSCDCGNYCFTWETANAKKGLSFLYYSNGEHPAEKNPSLSIGACKHLARVCRYLLSKRW
jgi:hypothetical protein